MTKTEAQNYANELFIRDGKRYGIYEVDGNTGIFQVELLPANDAPPPPTIQQQNSILDDESHYCNVDLLRHVDDMHLMKRLSLSIANATELPKSTVFLLGLGVFASMACRRWRVNYEHSGSLPISLYVVAEQPSGIGKTRCLNNFQNPFLEAQRKHIEECRERIKELEKSKDEDGSKSDEIKELTKSMQVKNFVTNATTEGIEQYALPFSKGFFSAVSSEQGLINSLLGTMYGNNGKKNNSDLILNGFDGGYFSSLRVTRNGYCGSVVGGIVAFAQDGTVQTILKESNGTGLSERFLMLAEKDSFGYRNFHREQIIDKFLIDEYTKICNKFAADILMNPTPYHQLQELNISKNGWNMVKQLRQKIEPELKAGGRFAHSSLRGAIGKIDMQIMKIAANLHILKHSHLVPSIIGDDTIFSAVGIMEEMTEAHLMMLQDKGLVGTKAEYSAVINYLSGRSKPATKREMLNSLTRTQPFASAIGGKSTAVKNAIDEMLELGLLTEIEGRYSIAS